MAVAETRRSPGTAASASSPTKSRGPSSVMVASLPTCETTVTFALALLKIEDRVCEISLGEERLFWLQLDNSSTKAGVSQKDLGIKNGGSRENHPRASLGLSNSRQKTWGDVFGNRHHSPVPDSSMIGGGQSV